MKGFRNKMKKIIAHKLNEKIQTLDEHLINVAEKSNEFFKLSRKLKFGLASNTFLSVLEKLASQIGSFMLMLASLCFMENLVLS